MDARWDDRIPARPKLGDGEVHVWRAGLDVDPARLAALAAVLCADEADRARRFRFDRDRDRFIAGRAGLRIVLSRYLCASPAELRFHYGLHGKPALATDTEAVPAGERLAFNLSHAGTYALIAVTPGRRIGVDLETIRPEVARGRIADRFFSPAEVACLRSLPEHEQPPAFFALWTLKEAYIKALGGGLSIPLAGFTVSLSWHDASATFTAADDPEASARWSLRRLDPGPGYAGALAVEGPIRRLHLWSESL